MSKKQTIRQKRQQEEQRKRFLGIGGLILVLLVALVLVLPNLLQRAGQGLAGDLVKPGQKPYPEANRNRLGSAAAPVTVIEFADFLCGSCQEYALTEERSFIEKYVASGKVQYEYVSIALRAPNQTKPIEAVYCAGDQNAFWPYRDWLYANVVEHNDALGDNYLTAYAKELNLDLDAFSSCLNTGKYKDKSQENRQKAVEANIPATPVFLVNGKLASRLDLISMVEGELAKVSSH